MASKKNEVAVSENKKELAIASGSQLPAFMQQDSGKGLENMRAEDMATPRLILMQATSKELTKNNKLSAGDFFHSATEEIFDKPLLVTPIYYDRRYILWNPRDSGGGILARSDDGVNWSPPDAKFEVKLDKKDGGHKVTWVTKKTVAASGLAEWGSMNPNDPQSPPAATLMHNFVFAFPDDPDRMPAVFTFQRSLVTEGRKFLTRLKAQRAPMFGTIFELSSTDETKGDNQFKGVALVGKGLIADDDLYQRFKDLNKTFSELGMKIKAEEDLADDTTGSNETDVGGPSKY